ncbi:hypothetical protein T190611E02C_40042 [Tenacibaculum sp. 190524A05c]
MLIDDVTKFKDFIINPILLVIFSKLLTRIRLLFLVKKALIN